MLFVFLPVSLQDLDDLLEEYFPSSTAVPPAAADPVEVEESDEEEDPEWDMHERVRAFLSRNPCWMRSSRRR